MSDTSRLKPTIFGAIAGAAALAIVGFGWGGWMTSGKSMIVADEMARTQVVAALVPICVEQSKRDPDVAAKLAELKNAVSYKRNEMLMQMGWATMPGSDEPNRVVAKYCMEKLEAAF